MKYIAHRGCPLKAPENTIPSFQIAAANEKYFGIECDIHQTKDDMFVVFHDDTLKRMLHVSGKVEDLNFSELQTYTFKSGRNIKKYPDLKIPLLSDFLDICQNAHKTAIIEIKNLNDITQVIPLLSLIEEYSTLKVIVISFNMNYLKFIRAISDIQLQLLISKIDDHIIYDCRANQIDLSLDKKIISKDVVKRLKKEGFKIGVWTIDDPRHVEIFKKMGVHYLTSDKL
ncbi:MAG: hypothetical protein JXC31_06110 [Acholeplasmataceae bacterium]|nr:hypothetical protein [Acholeplasmataceae bacterium]